MRQRRLETFGLDGHQIARQPIEHAFGRAADEKALQAKNRRILRIHLSNPDEVREIVKLI